MALPGERTIFIEADPSIDADGIPTQALLDSARLYIKFEGGEGKTNETLGNVDSLLTVLPITRRGFYVEVRGLTVQTGNVADAQNDIESDLDTYFRGLRPYVDGLDAQIDRNDTITNFSVSKVVQDVMEAYGGFADTIGFGIVDSSFLTLYSLSPGEMGKLQRVDFVV